MNFFQHLNWLIPKVLPPRCSLRLIMCRSLEMDANTGLSVRIPCHVLRVLVRLYAYAFWWGEAGDSYCVHIQSHRIYRSSTSGSVEYQQVSEPYQVKNCNKTTITWNLSTVTILFLIVRQAIVIYYCFIIMYSRGTVTVLCVSGLYTGASMYVCSWR